jgi:hypothetical protein
MGAKSAQGSAAAEQAPPDAAAPTPDAAPTAPGNGESSKIEELKQFAALKDQGILTDEEFTAKKAQILGL